jgi:hypothetical protein
MEKIFSFLLFLHLLLVRFYDIVYNFWWSICLPEFWVVVGLIDYVVETTEASYQLWFSWVLRLEVRTDLLDVE